MTRLYHNKKWLYEKYIEDGWSQAEIADFCDVEQSTIYKWMKKLDIRSRDMSSSHVGKRNGAWIDSPIKDYTYMYTKRTNIRLYGINAPELYSSDIGEKTLAQLGKDIVSVVCKPGRQIIIKTFDPGKYGRVLALLILDTVQVNQFLVSSGLAKEVYY